jgi:hypothetical protein
VVDRLVDYAKELQWLFAKAISMPRRALLDLEEIFSEINKSVTAIDSACQTGPCFWRCASGIRQRWRRLLPFDFCLAVTFRFALARPKVLSVFDPKCPSLKSEVF